MQTALCATLGGAWRAASPVQVFPAAESWSVSHLIDRVGIASFREEARRALAEIGNANALLSGPWAPYSFTGSLDG